MRACLLLWQALFVDEKQLLQQAAQFKRRVIRMPSVRFEPVHFSLESIIVTSRSLSFRP